MRRKLIGSVAGVVCLAGVASAATVVSRVSSDSTYSFDATGTCGPQAQTVVGIDRFLYRLWDTGKISVRESQSLVDTDDSTGQVLGRGSTLMAEVGVILPFDGKITVKEHFACKNDGQVFTYLCTFHVDNGIVTSAGQCVEK